MAEKNTQDNQKSKKKHNWIGIFLIALLLLFIGLAGYYLERDLEPVPDNQIEDSQVLDESEDRSDEESSMNGEESETQESEMAADADGEEKAETAADPEEKATGEEAEEERDAVTEETENVEGESDSFTVEDEDSSITADSDTEDADSESEQPAAEQSTETEEDESEIGEDADEEDQIAADSEEEITEIEDERDLETEEETTSSDMETETIQPDIEQGTETDQDDIAAESDLNEDTDEGEETTSSDIDRESEQPAAEQRVEGIDEAEQEHESEDSPVEDEESSIISDSDTEDAVEDQQVEGTAEPEVEDDFVQESEDQVESDNQIDGQVESDDQVDSEAQDDFGQELEDPSLLDRILSILGLSDSDFSQNLNILFVGLDDEESVALGTVEADSIMIAKLRPEINKLQVEYVDEDTIYKGQLLREYHNGDTQLAVEEITETEIGYYVYVNYQGFERVIDELGGVKITLDQEIKVPGLGLNLKAGDNLLSGKEALNFVRWSDSDSMARFERQKLLINSVLAKLRSNNILFNVKELYSTIVESYNSIETDINPVLAAEIFNYIRENDELELEFID